LKKSDAEKRGTGRNEEQEMQGLTLRQTLIDHVPARLEKIPSGKAELKTAKIRVVAQARTGTPSRLGGQQPPANCSQLEDKPAMPG
jgi:hypothetical protein